MLDFGSLLLATALSGACLSGTMLAIWLTARQANFVLTMAAGILLLVAHVIAFWQYGRAAEPWLAQLVLALLVAGFFLIFCSTGQYLDNTRYKVVALPVTAVMLLIAAVTAAGFDGMGFVIAYSTVAVLLVMIAGAFWITRTHDWRILAAVTMLAGSCAVSFALCALVPAANGQWTLDGAPDNWAERLNTIVAVACMTVVGALTISLHHLRTHNKLTAEAMTDPLTGLMNRRALSTLYGNTLFGTSMAVAMFDMDHFKRTNDVFGHPVGDRVLQRFAEVIREHAHNGVDGFRLGGEEFAIVMSRIGEDKANEIPRVIGADFAAEIVATRLGPLRSTVSVGIGFGQEQGSTLEEVLAAADAALYEAKRAGRNRVATANSSGLALVRAPELLSA